MADTITPEKTKSPEIQGPCKTHSVAHQQHQNRKRRRRCSNSLLLRWLSALSALTLLVLTCIYASHSDLLPGYKSVGRSPSYVLLVLRVLSEVAGLLLATTIAGTFEEIQWMLIGRNAHGPGLSFTDYLGLDPGTGVLGLFNLFLGTRIRKFSSRAWGAIRLIAMIVVPSLNIVIMGDVTTTITYDRVQDAEPTYTYGISTFNSSLANIWQPMADLLFSTNFMYFMADDARVVDLTPAANRVDCHIDRGSKEASTKQCRLTYYVAGGIGDFLPRVLGAGNAEADVYIAENQQGYIFEFEDGDDDWTYNLTTECSVFGAEIAAWALCLKNGKENKIQAKLVDCPEDVASSFDCQSSTSWLLNRGFAASLQTSHRRATIAYFRVNNTILSHEFDDNEPTIEAPISASELLNAFTVVFTSSNEDSPFAIALEMLGVGNNVAAAPIYAWWYFHGLSRLADNDREARRRGISGLESMLGLPIYHCQAKGLAEIRDLGYDNSTLVGQAILASFPANSDPATPVYPATLRYVIVIAPGTLGAYIVVGGLTLIACFVALGIVTFKMPSRDAREIGSFPALDFVTRCTVIDVAGNEDTPRTVRMEELRKLRRSEKMAVEKVRDMRVTLTRDDLVAGVREMEERSLSRTMTV